jgi:mannose-1-phosphate guanylyltransferase
MNKHLYVVIMAGGTGTRFWPYSRTKRPKQFLDILGTGKSLLQLTSERFASLAPKENTLIVSNSRYADILHAQFPDFHDDQLLLEPSKRNTAPCIAYAAYKIRQKDPDAMLVVTPADHAIFQEEKFLRTVQLAVDAATADSKLITIGIKATRPETGYGYIQFLESKVPVKKVKTFTEKPELDLAVKFLESGDFMWNAGIFVWSAAAIIKAFEAHEPEMAELFEAASAHYYQPSEAEYVKNVYAQCRNISVDYAILEKADNVYVVEGAFDWSDLGSWGTLHEIRSKDEQGNVLDGDVLLYDSSNNFVKLPKGKLAVLQDMNDYLVADFDDVLLICRKDQSESFRRFVQDVKNHRGNKLV